MKTSWFVFIVSVDRSFYANNKICWFWKEEKFLNFSEFGTLSCMLFERIGRPENVGTEGAGISEALYVLFHVFFNVVFVTDAWGVITVGAGISVVLFHNHWFYFGDGFRVNIYTLLGLRLQCSLKWTFLVFYLWYQTFTKFVCFDLICPL